MAQSSFSPEEAFWDKVPSRQPGECWKWCGSDRKYGRLRFRSNMASAHRVAYELAYGPIPVGMVVRHTCDNPPCVNPDHLILGTSADNTGDARQRGRMCCGVKHPKAKLNDSAVRAIRALRGKMTLKAIATLYGVSISLVHAVQSGRIWTHVPA